MTRTTCTAARAAAGALVLAVTLGGAGAAVAAPHSASAHHAAHAQSHSVNHAQRQVLVRIANLDASLAGALRGGQASKLDGAVRQQVADNVLADRDILSKLAAGVMANSSNVSVVRETLKGLRVANYRLVVNELARAAQLGVAVTEAQTALAGDSAAPVDALDAAVAALQDAVTQAVEVTGFSGKAEVRAVRTGLAKAQASLGVVEDYRASLVTPAAG